MEWKKTWSYLPIPYNTTIGTLENITQRTYIKNNLSGNRVKVCFSNCYGTEKLVMEQVVIGKRTGKAEEITEWKVLTGNGQERIVLQPGEEYHSDILDWKIEAGEEIVVSVFFKEKNNVQSACSNWSARRWHTEYQVGGNHCKESFATAKESREVFPYVEADVNKAHVCVGISQIWIETEERVNTIALFGDSITHMSYYNDGLSEMMFDKYPGKITFLNCGIGGNRVLYDASYVPDMPGEGKCFGEAAVKRFRRDVLQDGAPEVILILEGVNDLMHPYVFARPEEIVTAEELIAGLMQIAEEGKKSGARVYMGTIMPFGAMEIEWLDKADAVRQQVNEWIRSQSITDGVIDFDKVIQSDTDKKYMKQEYHIGDGLHPNTEGGICMATLVMQANII